MIVKTKISFKTVKYLCDNFVNIAELNKFGRQLLREIHMFCKWFSYKLIECFFSQKDIP